MRILALDSSGLVASVAIVAGADGKADAQTIGEYTMNYKKTHSQTLLPMLDELVNDRSGSENSGCHSGGGRTGIIYRTQNRIGNREGAWVGAEKTVDSYSDVGGTGL